MVGVHADLSGEIEGDGKAGLAFAQEVAVTLVGFEGGAEAGVLAHGPEAAAVHGGIDAAGKGEFSGIAEGGFGVPVGEIFFSVETIDVRPERVANLSLRSGGAADLALVSVMARTKLCDSRTAHVLRGWADARPLQNLPKWATAFARGERMLRRKTEITEPPRRRCR